MASRFVRLIAVSPDVIVIGGAPPAELGPAFMTRHMIAPALLLNAPTAASSRTRFAHLFDLLYTGCLLPRSLARACATIVFRARHSLMPQDVMLDARPSSALDASKYGAGISMQMPRVAPGRHAPVELRIFGKGGTEHLIFISPVHLRCRKCLDVNFTQQLVTFWARQAVVATTIQPRCYPRSDTRTASPIRMAALASDGGWDRRSWDVIGANRTTQRRIH